MGIFAVFVKFWKFAIVATVVLIAGFIYWLA